jgi:hypothetical protein
MKNGYSILFPKMSDKEFILIDTSSNLHISTEDLIIIAIVHLLFLNWLSLLFCRFYLLSVTGLESVSAGPKTQVLSKG